MNLLRTPDAANRLGVSQSYLEKQRCSGAGPRYAKIGRLVIYREEDLTAWITAHLRNSTSSSHEEARS